MSDFLNRFLAEYGYIKPEDAGDVHSVGAAVAQAEAAYGLPETGDATNPVVERVFSQTPRCGVSDAEGLADGQAYWGLKNITWFAESVPQGVGLNRQLVEAAIQQAFDHWSLHIPLTAKKGTGVQGANIVFRMGRGSRSDFDGPGGTLAWMEVCSRPDFKGQLNGALDGDEPFVVILTAAGIQIVNVLIHEIGHAWGFMHSRRGGQMMSPTYSRDIRTLQAEDIARAQSVYGKPTAEPPPPPPPPGSAPEKCQVLMVDKSIWEFSKPVKLRGAQP